MERVAANGQAGRGEGGRVGGLARVRHMVELAGRPRGLEVRAHGEGTNLRNKRPQNVAAREVLHLGLCIMRPRNCRAAYWC